MKVLVDTNIFVAGMRFAGVKRKLVWKLLEDMAEQTDLFQPNPQEKLAAHHLRNQKLFSSYYLAFKLPERSLWQALESKARKAFEEVKRAYQEMAAANLFMTKNEAETERVFIRPTFKALGFDDHFSVQPALDSYDAKRWPDYALFPDRESYEAAQRERENMRAFYGKAVAIGEAKYWGRPMNDPDPGDPVDKSDATKQLVGYLRDVAEWTDGKTKWGILTNGKLWRLFCRRADYTAENYVEIDLEAIIREDNFEAFKYFYALFSLDAFVPDPLEGIPWLESYLRGSEEYSSAITQRLKDLIFEEVFDSLAEGFVRYRRERLGVTHEDELTRRVVYQGCLTLLYRLLFLLNAESRQLLPLDNPGYRARSLRALMERIWEERDQRRDPGHDFEYWTHLERLFRMMDKGAAAFNLPKYNGGLFKRPDPGTPLEELREEEIGPWFLETHKLSDPYLRDVIERLTFDPEAPPGARAFIDYSSLGVRHLGEIYEGLLEFKIEIAEDEPVCAVGSRSQPKWKKQSEVEPGETVHVTKQVGQPYITNDKGERKATGSYYTPHYIVEYIVEHTIGPQLRRFEREKEWYDRILSLDADLQALYEEIMQRTVPSDEERGRLDTLWQACRNDEERRDFLLNHLDPEWGHHQFDPATRALELKVLDPAMGSGHFLVHAVDVIADRVADFLNKYPDSPVAEQLKRLRESILQNVREQGVQIDESKLNDINLIKRMVMKRCIYGVDLNPMAVELAKLSLWLDSFTVGAPLSFLDHHLKCGNSLIGAIDVSEHLPPGSQREKEFRRAVANLLLVADLTDATVSEVEQSQKLYEEAQKQLEPTKRRVNVELAKHFMEISDMAVGQAMDYAYKDQGQLEPKNETEKVHIENYRRAQEIARQKHFFHWELEFPEVWYTRRGRRANPGFDAVIGNPPYVRQEQITPNKDYFSAAFDVYRSAADLYVYFYEIAHRLLRPGGAFGMITSNKFMRAAYGKPLRKFLTQGVYVRQIIDFGDLPVFPDVSAYPCIAITSKEDRDGRSTSYLRVPSLKFGSLDRFVEENATSLPAEAFQEENWQLTGAAEHRILRKMERVSVPLERWLGEAKINYGIKTGFNEAFFIDEEMRERLIEEDPKSAEIIKPLVVGDDIKRYEIEFKNRYLIWTYVGVPVENYPAVFKHLKQYQEQLERRWDKGDHWWELRHCDYYEDFEKPKIIFGRFMDQPLFGFDKEGKYFTNDAMYIAAVKDGYPVTILNGRIGWLWLIHKCTDLRGQYIQVFIQDLNVFPIRRIFFTTPEGERQAQMAVLQRLYQEGYLPKLLEVVETCLPKDENGEFIVFSRSIPVKQAIEKGWLTEEQAENWALEPDDPSGYDEQGRPLERSDVIHDLLAYLAERMIELHKENRGVIEKFWTDLEGVTDGETFKKLRRGKQERTLAQSEACRPFVNPESGSTKTLESSLGWSEVAFREFVRLLAGRVSNLSDLVEVYRRYAPDFQGLMDKIEATDRLIDQIVYRLYGLTDEEIALVEGHREAGNGGPS